LGTHLAECVGIHGRPWISVDQAKVECLTLDNGMSMQVSIMTSEQFTKAIHLIIQQHCNTLNVARANYIAEKANAILDGLEDELTMLNKWYAMEELERIGIIFPTTLARKKLRKHHGGAPFKR
jgi:hypothetical protein